MTNLLYKEFNLTIHKFYSIIMPILTGALFFIPNWPFFIALMYLFMVSVPNLFGAINTQKDNEFSMNLPVRKKDIVQSRIITFLLLEMAHLVTGVLFGLIHIRLYGMSNFFMDINAAFFGLVLVMFSLYNMIFFPMYYKTGFHYGLAAIIGVVAIILFAGGIELLRFLYIPSRVFLEGNSSSMRLVQAGILGAGVIIFALSSLLTIRISVKRFEKVDL